MRSRFTWTIREFTGGEEAKAIVAAEAQCDWSSELLVKLQAEEDSEPIRLRQAAARSDAMKLNRALWQSCLIRNIDGYRRRENEPPFYFAADLLYNAEVALGVPRH